MLITGNVRVIRSFLPLYGRTAQTNLFSDPNRDYRPRSMTNSREDRSEQDRHKGKLYQSKFGTRMRGSGHYADMIEKRFRLACKITGLKQKFYELDYTKFVRSPIHKATQLEMF